MSISKKELICTCIFSFVIMSFFAVYTLPFIYEVSIIPGFSRYLIITGKTLESNYAFLKPVGDGKYKKYYKTTWSINNFHNYNLTQCDTYDTKKFTVNSQEIIYLDMTSIHKSSNDNWVNDNGYVYKHAICFTPEYVKPEMGIFWIFIACFALIILTIGYANIFVIVDYIRDTSNGYQTVRTEDSIQMVKVSHSENV